MGSGEALALTPISLREANAFVERNHRHHKGVTGHKFSIGCTRDGELVGVAIMGRPVSRYLDDGLTLEVNRLCTTGAENACSMLYGAAARAARAMGYQKIITYTLDTEMDYRALISNMGSSSTTRKTVDITIPEGYTIDQLFDLLDKRGVASVDRLRDMSANWDYAFDWLEGLPLGDYHRLEGYLFPDTYTFEMGENPKYVLNKMLVNFDAKMDQYLDRFTGEGENAPAYSLHDIVTIASLIEKETDGTNTDERSDYKSIASVIYNRLEHPEAETVGLLQIDATLVYLNGGKVPTEADKAIDSPYNTYKYQGLPPGPIANPGMTSLLAAMDPDSTSYYYYALNPETKQHEYSRTYAEHQALLDQFSGNG